MRILIAEDEPVSRRVLEAALIHWNHEVVVTCGGNEAWEHLQRPEAPHLIILDVMMPGLTGLEICKNVRQQEHVSPPYIILLTAETSKEHIVTGLETGANDYITKPFDPDELRARLHVGVRMIEMQQVLADRLAELEAAMGQVKQLQGMLPICSYCKSIRDDDNYWQKVESYISDHSEAQFTHGICPKCYDSVISPQLKELRAQR